MKLVAFYPLLVYATGKRKWKHILQDFGLDDSLDITDLVDREDSNHKTLKHHSKAKPDCPEAITRSSRSHCPRNCNCRLNGVISCPDGFDFHSFRSIGSCEEQFSATTLNIYYLESNNLEPLGKNFQLEKIQTLNLPHGNINSINENDLSYSENLLSLDLRDSKIKKFTSKALPATNKLKTLKLSKNSLSEIENGFSICGNLKRLKNLALSSNQLTAVQNFDFQNCYKLQALTLSENLISEISDGSFHRAVYLKKMSFR